MSIMQRFSGPVLLDGGMGQEIQARGDYAGSALWSAAPLLQEPALIQDIHEDYILAGADIITTNSYAIGPNRLQRFGAFDDFVALNIAAGELANRARESTGTDVAILGSLGPMYGSYRPAEFAGFAEAHPAYQRQVEVLAPFVDGFLCETMSTIDESRAASRAAAESGKPVWIAWTVDDGHNNTLRSGESLPDAIDALADIEVEALVLNCSSPEVMASAVEILRGHDGRPIGVYANGFTPIPEGWAIESDPLMAARTDLDPATYAEFGAAWLERGATIIGGCCEVGPAHIRALRELIDQAPNDQA